MSPADALLLQKLLEVFDRFAQQNHADLNANMADTRTRIGDIQLRLGRGEEAVAAYTESEKTYLTLCEASPSSIPLLIAHAKAWNRLGVAYSQTGQVMQAMDAHRHAGQLLEETSADREALEVQLELAQSLILADTVFIRAGTSEVMSELWAEMFRFARERRCRCFR